MASRYLTGDRARRVKQLLVSVYGAKCAKCGQVIDLSIKYPDPYSLSIGHQLPLSRGGGDGIENLRPEHLGCNTGAGNRIASDGRMPVGDDRFF